MATDRSLPLPLDQDSLRDGLGTLKDKALSTHPVEKINAHTAAWDRKDRYEAMRNLYGNALPARMHIERQFLERNPRLGPFESSNISYDAYSGALGEFSFESYLGLPETSEVLPIDTHSQMEMKLGMQTEPCKRGFF
ncbi:hypothetical protein BSKO_01290 [Bryopsis sp. KO-2023]|nr:hypothetical protein BSKO_01290 [Bryopsis sp. KO-2023]